MSQWILGLTGGIASGKTTMTNFFKGFGCHIVDADVIARQVVEPGTIGLHNIANHFGLEILNNDGTLNRSKLRQIVFSDEQEKQWLNNLMHPLIREESLKQLHMYDNITNIDNKEKLSTDIPPYTIFVAPLLFENNLAHMTNHILCMYAPIEQQIARTMERDHCSKEIAINIINSQFPLEQKISLSDDSLCSNKNSPEELLEEAKKLHDKYLQLAKDYK